MGFHEPLYKCGQKSTLFFTLMAPFYNSRTVFTVIRYVDAGDLGLAWREITYMFIPMFVYIFCRSSTRTLPPRIP